MEKTNQNKNAYLKKAEKIKNNYKEQLKYFLEYGFYIKSNEKDIKEDEEPFEEKDEEKKDESVNEKDGEKNEIMKDN